MKSLLARLVGANRPKIIAVFGATRAEVELSLQHARAAQTGLPIWAWCGEAEGQPAECDRFFRGATTAEIQRQLKEVWPALSIVAWTGSGSNWPLKLLPLLTPPFRVLVQNEAGGFFPASPVWVGRHAARRVRDAVISGLRRVRDWTIGISGRFARWLLGRLHWALGALAWFGRWMSGRLHWAAGVVAWTMRWVIGRLQWVWSLLYRGSERLGDGLHWLFEAQFAAWGYAAEQVPELAPFLMSRLHPRPLAAAAPVERSVCGSRYVEVAISNRSWPRRAVLKALADTQADFVVLRMRGETGDAGTLIDTALETGAFAVAKQSAYSAWRKPIITKHPFRALQEGEVSDVRAPWSTLIAIRRKSFATLGCPHAFTFGAALMMLFWKASASGMRSLVAGRGPVPDESAMALEDTEFALRLNLTPGWNTRAPRDGSLSRGNIASFPGEAQSSDKRLRVLVVSPYLPYPLSHGGAVRIFNLCRAMSGEVDFVLACFREHGERVHYPELHDVFRQVLIVDADEKPIDASVPRQVAEYRTGAMQALVRRLCLDHEIDLVQLEYTQMAEYRECTGSIPVILVEHDVTFTLYRQLAEQSGEAAMQAEFERWLEFERAALQCSNLVWTVSESDRTTALAYGARRERTSVVPNGVDLARFQPIPERRGLPPQILFVGSFRHLPNLLAFETLRNSIMPAVWREAPDAILHVVAGPDHERAARMAGKPELLAVDPRIVLEGFVEDVRGAYREANMVAVPLPVSAGTNIKVMEAMACGRAVVSTPVGCQGLDLRDGRDISVAELGPQFVAAILALLANPDLREHMGQEARKTAERRFGWDAIAADALQSYELLTGTPMRSAVKSA